MCKSSIKKWVCYSIGLLRPSWAFFLVFSGLTGPSTLVQSHGAHRSDLHLRVSEYPILLESHLRGDSAFAALAGVAVDINGDWAFVGAINDATAGERAGAVYVFRYIADAWIHYQTLLPRPNSRGQFGFSISSVGNFVAVGAVADDSNGPWSEGINGGHPHS